mmetsp:Transcript_35561/g.65198  ORF Transcript_35561/g.65198 Transcript_35561/m.65198 type:complete len:491 (-) Transcript_35561:280-1752(-)
MVDGYTHMVIAFAVSYEYSEPSNNCDAQCNIAPLPICVGETSTTVSDWQGQGKKIVLSFGGAGMGGSWSGNTNNCWDYCFGKEEQVATELVSIVNQKGLNGIDIDYEYCYDTENNRHDGCNQVSPSLYSDAAAQNFLSVMTSMLRQKLDTLGPDYELTHAPMDSDLVPSSPYYQILKDQNANLNFLMPQFYNGITRPVLGGFDGVGPGQTKTSVIYDYIANGIFPGQPDKVVFGFCVSQCANTANGSEAVQVLQQVKAYNSGEFACNGGAFFWVASYDTGGSWSAPVYAEVSQTSGCSDSGTSNPTTSPSKAPSPSPSTSPTKSPILAFPGECSDGTGSCSELDLSRCTCAARRNLLKGKEVESIGLKGKQKKNLRMLGKKTPSPTQPATPGPTPSPVPPTLLPTASPSNQPTKSPTKSPTPLECTCILPTPGPTPSPTQPATPEPTSNPTPPSNCSCLGFTQKNLCDAGCGGNACGWTGTGKTKTCGTK